MCWNASVSLQTFLFSTIPLVLCFYLGLISVKTFVIFQNFISIQLAEYFLWTYLDTPWNMFFSKVCFFIILLLVFNSIVFSTISYKWYLLSAYLLFVLYLLSFPIQFHTSIAKNKHLSWNWLKFPFPIVLVLGLFFLIPSLNSFDMVAMFTFTSFWITLYTYYKTNTYGSMRCWIGNLNSLYTYAILLRYFLSYSL